jgi:putative transcriptional regulator
MSVKSSRLMAAPTRLFRGGAVESAPASIFRHFDSNEELKMPSDIQRFQDDLLESVRQMRKGKAARVTQVKLSAAAEARAHCGLSQQEFAALLGVSPRTLQDWEQGRREPTGAARTLLRVAAAYPDVLRDLRG